jgi:hypothetical protein
VKLVYVFMTLGESRLVAGVDDGAGKLRRIETTWAAKDDAHLPPPTWAETVRGEADFQRTEDANPNPVRRFL